MAADQVVHPDDFVLGHLEADDPLVAAVDAGPDFVGGKRQRSGELFAHGVVVGERFAAGFGLVAQGVELLGRIERVVSPACFDELQGVFQIDFAPLALAVGGVGAADTDALVDFDAAPLERVHDILLGSRHEALRIGVFDAQNHRTFVLAGEKIVVERRADAADVQRARGAGGKTNSYGFLHFKRGER